MRGETKAKPGTPPTPKRRRILLAMDMGGFTVERRQGIAEYAREANWILETRLVAFSVQQLHAEYLASFKFDGILSLLHGTDPQLAEITATAGVPVVDMWQDFPELRLPRVLPDNRAVGRLAAEHLLDLGLKNLLFYTHTVDRRVALVRRDGFEEVAAARGARVRELWWDSRLSQGHEGGRISWLADQLLGCGKPLGVLAMNDAVAGDIFDAAEHAGLHIPEDLAVIGCDNDPILTELGRMPLTSIDLARARVGYEAAALLDRILNGQPPPDSPLLIEPARVVPRRSTQMLAVADPDVARAIHFIQEHFRHPISVNDVAAATFLSRRQLQDRFQEDLGRGINDEIIRQRLQFAKTLLVENRQKISTIATASGFTSVHHMSKVFRRELETSPKLYRSRFQHAR